MRWVLAIAVSLGIGTLGRVFLMHARAIRRDINSRFDALRERLEHSANSVVDHLLDTRHASGPDSGTD